MLLEHFLPIALFLLKIDRICSNFIPGIGCGVQNPVHFVHAGGTVLHGCTQVSDQATYDDYMRNKPSECPYSPIKKATVKNNNLFHKIGWTDWTAWSTCSQSCDPGVEERTRDCLDPKTSTVVAGENCSLVAVIDSLQRPCNLIDCIREGEARNMGLLIKT